MAKTRKRPYWVEETEETLEIHITGEILHDLVLDRKSTRLNSSH